LWLLKIEFYLTVGLAWLPDSSCFFTDSIYINLPVRRRKRRGMALIDCFIAGSSLYLPLPFRADANRFLLFLSLTDCLILASDTAVSEETLTIGAVTTITPGYENVFSW
jgi:hypothetical protein